MTLPVVFSRQANRDLIKLENYLAKRFSESNADKYVRRIAAECLKIGTAPYRGTIRNEIRPGVRSTGFEKKVAIYFEAGAASVTILRVLYGGKLLKPPDQQ